MKIIKSLLLFGSMVMMSIACQREAVLSQPATQGEVVSTTIQVSLPADMATKAIGDGSLITQLVFAALASDGQLLFFTTQDMSNGAATIQTSLIKGKEYILHFMGTTNPCLYAAVWGNYISVNAPSSVINDEYFDVFTANVEYTGGDVPPQVTLQRAVAQLNVGITAEDYQWAQANGVDMSSLKVKLQFNAPKMLWLMTGEAENWVEYANSVGNPALYDPFVVDEKNYYRLAYSYVLAASNCTSLENVTVTLSGKRNSDDFELQKQVSNVPVAPNKQTNIIGDIIKPGLEP